jgi:hypothetical protein
VGRVFEFKLGSFAMEHAVHPATSRVENVGHGQT